MVDGLLGFPAILLGLVTKGPRQSEQRQTEGENTRRIWVAECLTTTFVALPLPSPAMDGCRPAAGALSTQPFGKSCSVLVSISMG